MKKRTKKKPIILLLAVVMAFVMMLSATFAWFTSADGRVNHFETLIMDGSVTIFELFNPPTDWKPGESITKNVAATNNGEADVLVRLSFEEVLRMLGNDAAQHSTTAPVTANADLTGLDLPVTTATAGYTVGNGWVEITNVASGGTALGLAKVSGIPTGAKVWGKSATDADGKIAYTFTIYMPVTYKYTHLDGTVLTKTVNQKMTADFEVTDTGSKELTVSNAKYWYYTAKTTTQVDWAADNEKIGKAPYETGSFPSNAQTLADVETLLADSNEMLKLVFGTAFDNSASVAGVADNKWWYNEDDGYFYYLGAVAPGTTTENLLEGVTLHEDAGNEYGLLEYDLIVLLEAIQNTTDAVKSASGWNINDTSDIYTKLAGYCAY